MYIDVSYTNQKTNLRTITIKRLFYYKYKVRKSIFQPCLKLFVLNQKQTSMENQKHACIRRSCQKHFTNLLQNKLMISLILRYQKKDMEEKRKREVDER